MGLSSNILWHQTTLDGLKGILNEQGFFYSYSLESILSRESKNNLNVAFPMVSLCDLPFSELNDYIKKYGGYLIGMKRTWGKSNGLAPVWYCDSESTILNAIIDRYNQIEVNIKNGKNFTISREIFLYTLSHIKNYEGQLIAHDFNKYRFYDEREFRSVPRYKELKKLHPTIQPYLSEKDYQDYKRKHKNTLIKTLKLSFEWEDIRYIVVKRKQDIKTISELLQNLAPDIHPQIFTTQQILEDVVVFQKVCLGRCLQILQICKYSDSWFQNNTPRRVVLLFVL